MFWLDRELNSYSPVSDELILAAVERAQIHEAPHLNHHEVSHHLGFAHRAWTTRQLLPQIEALVERGLLEATPKRGRDAYDLTAAGRRRLRRARKKGEVDPLPEAPQHRRWRRARRIAEENLPEILATVTGYLHEADQLDLARPNRLEPERLFELSAGLEWNLWRLGAAVYCLYEWAEPDDARPDPRPERIRSLPHSPDAFEWLDNPTSSLF